MKKIAVSYLGVKSIPKAILMIDKTDADYVHVDVMDGKYTDYKTVGFNEMTIGKYTQKRLDVHLMVKKPLKYIDDFADLNVDCINIHVDIKNDVMEVINRIKLYGIRVGLVLNPDQDVSLIEEYLPEERLEIRFKVVDEDTRVLIFKPYGEKYEELCEAIL